MHRERSTAPTSRIRSRIPLVVTTLCTVGFVSILFASASSQYRDVCILVALVLWGIGASVAAVAALRTVRKSFSRLLRHHGEQ
jgi:hypothetical protein